MKNWIRTPELTFYTDFNSVDEEGRLISARSTLSGDLSELHEGVPARVSDYEGNSMLAFIESVHERYVTLEPKWETWVGPSPFHITERRQVSDAPTLAGATSYARVA